MEIPFIHHERAPAPPPPEALPRWAPMAHEDLWPASVPPRLGSLPMPEALALHLTSGCRDWAGREVGVVGAVAADATNEWRVWRASLSRTVDGRPVGFTPASDCAGSEDEAQRWAVLRMSDHLRRVWAIASPSGSTVEHAMDVCERLCALHLWAPL